MEIGPTLTEVLVVSAPRVIPVMTNSAAPKCKYICGELISKNISRKIINSKNFSD